MRDMLRTLEFLLICLAGASTERDRLIHAFLREGNRVLRQQLGRRPRLNDDQRRRLAVLGKPLGRKALQEWATIVTPDTILRWYHRLVASKFDTSDRRGPGRPPVINLLRKWVVRMALDNPTWGYDRIEGEIRKLGHRLAPTTVRNILNAKGIQPAPERRKRTTWRAFLRTHWSCLAATDFFTVEAWGCRGLVTYYVLFAIDLSTRRVHIAGITPNPHEAWMLQIGRNLTDPVDGFLNDTHFLIMDRDTKYTKAFRDLLETTGVRPVRLPHRSPNLNAYAERFVRSIKAECTRRVIFLGERSLRHAINEYVDHYNEDRPHQGIDNRIPGASDRSCPVASQMRRHDRLGGLLRSYRSAA